jgi:O-antigen/teichoic acid export membrane protein
VLLLLTPISGVLGYADNPPSVWVMALIVAIDAFRAIPFAYLRQQKKALEFASLQLLNVGVNIALNCIYYLALDGHDPGYAFYINLVCSALITLCLYREIANIRHGFDKTLFHRMLSYSWPIVILGIAGILNQVADKILFPYIYEGADAKMQLGIYGACAKIAMIMAMITQAFRYAYEPIVFAKAKDKDKNEYYAHAMKFFIIFTLFAFLCVMGYMPILEHILGSEYRAGLQVVPIVMVAEIMMGIYFNLSFWYKLIDKTIWGAWFSLAGCVTLVAVNILFIPKYSYMACAWGGVAGYGTAMLLSYFVGQKKYPISYDLKGIFTYIVVTTCFYYAMDLSTRMPYVWLQLLCNTLLILAYLVIVVKNDVPLKSIPVIGKRFRG